MQRFRTVLAVIEQRQMRQPALMRALSLATYAKMHRGPGAPRQERIIAVMPVYDFSWDLSSVLSVQQGSDIKQEVLDKQRAWLQAYLQVNAIGYDVKPVVVWSKNAGRDVLEIAQRERCDLIIKTPDVHGMLDAMIFTPLDWQLLRNSHLPVYIAKDHLWTPTGIIAVAIAVPSDDEDGKRTRESNMRMLREAQELSRFTRCQIHLINAIIPIIPPATLDLPGFTPQMVSEENLKESCKQILMFAARHNIPPEHCHIREGHPDEVIPELCRELRPTALFIGTSARRGLPVALLGNICERVVDETDCDIAVITPSCARDGAEQTPPASEK